MTYEFAGLYFEFYIPEELEEGMIFVNLLPNFTEFWILEEVPENMEEFIVQNGFPVTFNIVRNDGVIAEGDAIAMFDPNPDDPDAAMYELTLTELNTIFQRDQGAIMILIDEEDDEPFYTEEDLKVVITYYKDDE